MQVTAGILVYNGGPVASEGEAGAPLCVGAGAAGVSWASLWGQGGDL